MEHITVIEYETPQGKNPFATWIEGLDKPERSIILARLGRVRLGNFGACKQLKGALGLWELIIDHGPGFRIYFGKQSNILVIVLCAGQKRTQVRDIEKAKEYWKEYWSLYEKKY